MSTICIPIPDLHKHSTVGLEVTIDGKRHVMNYRIDSFAWESHLQPTDRIARLREFLADYDSSWDLVQIGPPDGEVISVTFRQHVAVETE